MQLFSSATGSEFLLLYTGLLGGCWLASKWLETRLRSPGRRDDSLDPESLALLAGGPARYADTVIADLFVSGALVQGEDGRLVARKGALATAPGGRALLAAPAPFASAEADRLLAIEANRAIARLRRDGLMLAPDALAFLRWAVAMPFLPLFALGLYRQRLDSTADGPIGLLGLLLALTVSLAVIRVFRTDRRTRGGIAALEAVRAKAKTLREAPGADEAALAVALFGTGVLVGTAWEPVHTMRQQGSGAEAGDGGGGEGCGEGGGDGCGD